jgi:multisubunit Na+/H+ antiporter MnhF subunit
MAKNKNNPTSVRTILTLSAISAALVGIIVFYGVRPADQMARLEGALIWAGLTFVVAIVSIATLILTVKDDPRDPDQPALK